MTILSDQVVDVSAKTLNIIGPGWKAKVRLLKLQGPSSVDELGFRSLFVEQKTRSFGSSKVLTPRTLLVACKVIQVSIELRDIARWPAAKVQKLSVSKHSVSVGNSTTPSDPESSDEVTLLLGVDADKWASNADNWPEMNCLGGVIDLSKVDKLKIANLSSSDPVSELFETLELAPSGLDQTAIELWADGSGLLLHGAVDLPWQSPPSKALSGWFRLGPGLLPGEQVSSPALSLIPQRLSQQEKQDWDRAWELLRDGLQGEPAKRPVWLGLEADKTLPELLWPIQLNDARPSREALLIDPRAISVILRDSDYAPDDKQSGPRSLARIEAEKITLLRVDNKLIFTVISGQEDITDVKQLTISSSLNSGDSLSLSDCPLAFDPLQVPEELRKDQKLQRPEPSNDDKIDDSDALSRQPVIWSFMPLVNGWAQLPIPNLIAEDYLVANELQADADSQHSNILQGALNFSAGKTSFAETSVTPWNLTITAAQALNSTWVLDIESLTLTKATVRLVQANIILNGLFYLSTGRPRPEDALPNMDDWVSSLRSITLRNIAAFHYPPMVKLQSTLLLEPVKKLYNLQLSSVLSVHDLANKGRSLVIVALVNGLLHIRIFDSYGEKVVDKSEAMLLAGELLKTLKKGLDPLPDEPGLSSEKKQEFIGNALAISTYSHARITRLSNWSFFFTIAEDSLSRFPQVFPTAKFASQAPLVWLRHPTLPTIQALPMTQTLLPANHPSASRSLAPFELPRTSDQLLPESWLFECTEGMASQVWPNFAGELKASSDWQHSGDALAMVILSLPGAALLPNQKIGVTPAALFDLQYRYDLPYTDELHALATLASPSDVNVNSITPSALTREAYANHWQQLTTKAALAAIDARQAYLAPRDNQERDNDYVFNLIEPYQWPVTVTLEQSKYPGSLLFTEPDGSVPLVLQGLSALEGISGDFSQIDGSNSMTMDSDGELHVTAGSMAGLIKQGRMRDQRGLWRGSAVNHQSDHVLINEVQLEGEQPLYLMSLLTPVTIQANTDTDKWQFWFKDLPATLDTQIYTFRSERDEDDLISQDINNPNAHALKHNYRLGYEWRFGPCGDNSLDSDAGIIPFHINGLDFFVLGPPEVQCDDVGVKQVMLRGRLQLPLHETPREQTGASNTVWVTCSRHEGQTGLEISDITAREPGQQVDVIHTWPLTEQRNLSKDDNASDDAVPFIEWKSIKWKNSDASLLIEDPILRYRLFGAERQHKLKPIRFSGSFEILDEELSEPASVQGLFLNSYKLNLKSNGAHQLFVTLKIFLGRVFEVEDAEIEPTFYVVIKDDTLWGIAKKFYKQGHLYPRIHRANLKLIGTNPDRIYPGQKLLIPTPSIDQSPTRQPQEQSLLNVNVAIDLTDKKNLPVISASIWGQEVEATSYKLSREHLAFQLKWQRLKQNIDSSASDAISLLPGITLSDEDAPGFVGLRFLPDLTLASATLEMLLPCSWGTLWPQHEHLTKTKEQRIISEQLFQSSAGDLVCCYSAHYIATEESWDDKFLMSGTMEVNSLVSWPEQTALGSEQNQLTIPGTDDPGLNHTRHIIRMIFNQHQLPLNLLIAGGERLLFNLQASKAWQFLTNVEHCLLELKEDTEPDMWSIVRSRSWSSIQEVRLFRPAFFLDQLQQFQQDNPQVFDPLENLTDFDKSDAGWFNQKFSDSLMPALEVLPDELILIEASAPFWLRQMPMVDQQTSLEILQRLPNGVQQTPLETLQFLPGGIQTCRLSQPEQFAYADNAYAWLLLPMPFLGRLYSKPQEIQDDSPVANSISDNSIHPLLSDPLKIMHNNPGQNTYSSLVLLLSHRRKGSTSTASFFAMDSSAVHTFTELDPDSLMSSWLAIQNPADEHPLAPDCIISNNAQGPGRLSRQIALENLFSPCRTQSVTADGSYQDASESFLEWRPEALFSSSQIGFDNDEDEGRVVGWHVSQLLLTGLAPIAAGEHVLHPAATLLPAACHSTEPSAPQSLAVSPYLSFSFERCPSNDKPPPFSVFIELLSISGDQVGLRPVAAKRLEKAPDNNWTWQSQAQDWATKIHQRLSPDSPLAILRLRQLINVKFNDIDKVLTRYDFLLVNKLTLFSLLENRAPALRTEPAQLRFREGQFGGQVIPDPEVLSPLALAAPLVTDSGPIYCRDDLQAKGWPWGLSAFTFAIQYSKDKQAIVEPDQKQTHWWQALQYRVQYQPSGTNRVTGGLPPSFRAPAIAGFLPVIAGMKLPEPESIPLPDKWASVVPGSVRAFLIGERSGAMIAIRSTLIRQDINNKGNTITSGSIPVQHRVPRPVELPVNRSPADPENALQTWASYFEADKNALVSSKPVDEAYFAPSKVSYTITQETMDYYQAAGFDENILEDLKNQPIVGRALFLKKLNATLNSEQETKISVILQHVQRGYGCGNASGLRMTLISPNLCELNDDWDGRLCFSVSVQEGLGIKIITLAEDADRDTEIEAFKLQYQSAQNSHAILILGIGSVARQWHIAAFNYFGVFTQMTLNSSQTPDDILIGQLEAGVLNQAVEELVKSIIGYTKSHFDRLSTVTISIQNNNFKLKNTLLDTDKTISEIEYKLAEADMEQVRLSLSQQHSGSVVVAKALVQSAEPDENYEQILEFSLRIHHSDTPRLPLLPTFIHFEDPEFNRKLATPTVSNTTMVKTDDKQTYVVRFVADRRIYRPDDLLVLRYDWDDEALIGEGSIKADFIEKGNLIKTDLSLTLKPGELNKISLEEIKPQPKAGDLIKLELIAKRLTSNKTWTVILDIEITDQATTPSPDSAYGLLRSGTDDNQNQSLPCCRYAWGARPTHVDMICPTDLLTDLVRRRAVFHWQNSGRSSERADYKVQKISQNGSTHFFNEFEE